MGKRKGPRPNRKRQIVRDLGMRYGMKCTYCDRRLSYDGPPHLRPTVDHVIPLSAGGTNHFRNLVLACFRCNHRKGDGPADVTNLRKGVEHDGVARRLAESSP